MKNKNAGFTILEIVTSLAVGSILVMAAGSILVAGNRAYGYYAMASRSGELGDAAVELVTRQLQYADQIVIDDGRMENEEMGNVIEFTENGDFTVNDVAVYGGYKESGLNWGCRILLQNHDYYILRFEVYIKDKAGNLLYQSGRTVKLLNMEQQGTNIVYRKVTKDEVIDSKDQGISIFYQDSSQEYYDDE